MTLALLLTAVTGAWAETTVTWDTETWASWTDNTVKTHTVDGVTITAGGNATALKSSSGDYLYIYANSTSTNTLTFSAEAPITRIEMTKATASSSLNVSPLDGWSVSSDGTTVTWEGTATKSLVCETCTLTVSKIKFYLEDAPVTVDWNASTKTGTFTMPGSDVVLTPIYANAAAFATTGTGSEATTLLPAAAEGVIAGTDASLIAEGTGIVANIGETTTAQGTLKYAIGSSATEAPELTAFSTAVPTAENIADDGATIYVWYYIQGADAPQGEAATLDNTFNDTEPACLTVQVLTNKFDITFNAANANTIEAGKATVTVDGTDKTSDVTEGKLQGVKMGSEVKLEAKPGYKFRKVEVKKAEAGPLAAAFEDGAKIKVGYQWNSGNTTYLEFTNSGGTYSLTSVSGLNEANGFNSSTLTVKDSNVLALDVVCQPWGWSKMDEFSAQIEFDATSSTYKYSSKGGNFTGIISVSVNDTDITSQLTEVK